MSRLSNWRPPAETEYLRERPKAEHENAAMPATIHNPDWDHGVETPPPVQVCPETGWLVRERDPRDNGYDGANAEWRE